MKWCGAGKSDIELIPDVLFVVGMQHFGCWLQQAGPGSMLRNAAF